LLNLKSVGQSNLEASQGTRNERYAILAKRISDLVVIDGIVARPWKDPSLPYFTKLSESAQEDLLHYLEIQGDVIARVSHGGHDLLKSCRRLALGFLKDSGLEPASDLLDHLEDDDYLAAYNHKQQMIFLSPNHLRLTSYSIEDLLCRPWPVLFRRNEMIEKILISRAIEFGRGLRTQTLVNSDIPPHFLTEVESTEVRSVTVQSKLYSPLFRDGQSAGFVSVNRSMPSISRAMPKIEDI